jgi:hypothetical protein
VKIETQRDWCRQHVRRTRELGALRYKGLRNIAVAASLADGVGVRGVRRGAYQVADMLLLLDAAPVPLPTADLKRMNELEIECIPRSRAEWEGLDRFKQRVERGA